VTARAGVLGHVEWVQLAVVDHVPRAGEIAAASWWGEEAAGGGAVAAVQIRRLAGAADFFTALGDDDAGRRAGSDLVGRHGVALHVVWRPEPQRRALVHLVASGERALTVLGGRLVAHGDDDLPWERFAELDAVYVTGGDADAIRAARRARLIVATPRAFDALVEARVPIDVMVSSSGDRGEQVELARLAPPPRFVVATRGDEGGRWTGADGSSGSWSAVAPPGPPVDAYGCGDSFAGGVTYGLAAGLDLQAALEVGARCGAWCLAGRGPYGNQLGADDL
jgi:ribokinase